MYSMFHMTYLSLLKYLFNCCQISKVKKWFFFFNPKTVITLKLKYIEERSSFLIYIQSKPLE